MSTSEKPSNPRVHRPKIESLLFHEIHQLLYKKTDSTIITTTATITTTTTIYTTTEPTTIITTTAVAYI